MAAGRYTRGMTEPVDPDRAAILARRRRFIALAIGGLSTGCTPDESASEGGTTTVASSATESSTSSGVTTETGIDPDPDPDPSTSGSGFVPPTPRPCLSECDPYMQDCPEGEKCIPYASAGENWDANKCVPVEGDKGVGEPCTYDEVVTATDDCDQDSHCWQLQLEDGVFAGVCTAFCGGTADDPNCAEGLTCLIANEGSITACVAACDPLAQDCGEGLGCAWDSQAFSCMVTSAGLAAGEPCGFANDCAPGSVCIDAEASLACEGAACCVDYCDLTAPDACADPQLECAAMFAEGRAPEGLESVGLCVAPGACDEDELPGCSEHPIADNLEVPS